MNSFHLLLACDNGITKDFIGSFTVFPDQYIHSVRKSNKCLNLHNKYYSSGFRQGGLVCKQIAIRLRR
jgi:hypothetical protein